MPNKRTIIQGPITIYPGRLPPKEILDVIQFPFKATGWTSTKNGDLIDGGKTIGKKELTALRAASVEKLKKTKKKKPIEVDPEVLEKREKEVAAEVKPEVVEVIPDKELDSLIDKVVKKVTNKVVKKPIRKVTKKATKAKSKANKSKK